MRKLRTIIVDDDPLNIVDLKEYLKPYHTYIDIVAECLDGFEASSYMNVSRPDLAFLDVEMPGMNGFQMLSRLDYSPIIVFITAHAEFALKSYDYSPSDFLLKPVEPLKLERAIQNAINDFHSNKNDSRLINQQTTSGHLQIRYKDQYGVTRHPFITPSDILYIRTLASDAHYIEIFMVDGSQIGPVRQSLAQIKRQLDQTVFIQIYRNILANKSHFKELVDNKTLILNHTPPIQLEVSRRYRKAVKQSIPSNAPHSIQRR